MDTVLLILFIIALVAAVIELLRTRGSDLVAWSAALIAVGLILARVV